MQLSAPNSLTALSATLNGTQVFRLSDFAAGATSADPVATRPAGSRLAVQGAAATGNVNAAPRGSIAARANADAFAAGVSIALSATAADSDGTVAKVEFYDGATLLGRAVAAPYGAPLASAPDGSHTLSAVATDN